jgi:hypothetical protein
MFHHVTSAFTNIWEKFIIGPTISPPRAQQDVVENVVVVAVGDGGVVVVDAVGR